ncbi:hypothetical protein MC885_016793 [Smutsia gigantea]|nr:hypothetical protein MC885_016793 [Smutsia gigantea]
MNSAMFSLCMVESGADEVNLHGVTSLGLKQALEFAYTGQVNRDSDGDTAWEEASQSQLDRRSGTREPAGVAKKAQPDSEEQLTLKPSYKKKSPVWMLEGLLTPKVLG